MKCAISMCAVVSIIAVAANAQTAPQQQSTPWAPVFGWLAVQSNNCEGKFRDRQITSHIEVVNCSFFGTYEALRRAGYPYLDLIQLWIDQDLVTAEQLDAGKITEIEARAKNQSAMSSLITQVQQRDAARTMQMRAAQEGPPAQSHAEVERTAAELEAQRRAAEAERRAHQLCIARGLLAPSRDFGSSVANTAAMCNGVAAPQPPSVTTSCRPNGLDGSFICDTQ